MAITKRENLLNLYSKLPKDGARNEANKYIAKACKRSVNTVKSHWIPNNEIPEGIDEKGIDESIEYLQKAVKAYNDKINSIEVNQPETVKTNPTSIESFNL